MPYAGLYIGDYSVKYQSVVWSDNITDEKWSVILVGLYWLLILEGSNIEDSEGRISPDIYTGNVEMNM